MAIASSFLGLLAPLRIFAGSSVTCHSCQQPADTTSMTNPEIIGYVCTISFAVAGILALVSLYIFFRGKESSCAVLIAKFRKKHVPTLVEKKVVARFTCRLYWKACLPVPRRRSDNFIRCCLNPKTYDLRSVPPLSLSLKLFVNHILNLSFSCDKNAWHSSVPTAGSGGGGNFF